MIKIPRIIHYCWISEEPKSKLIQRCIASWKKYCPDWLIVQWNKENILPFENDFIREAYELKKYAFVADYIRIYALLNFGGVYIDSDVELKASLNPFLNHSFFISQTRGKFLHVAPDCFGAEKGHPLLKEIIKYYQNNHFINKDGKLNQLLIGIRIHQFIYQKYKFKLETKITTPIPLPGNGSIYPTYYFEENVKGKPNIANHFILGSWRGKAYLKSKYLADCYISCKSSLNNISVSKKYFEKNDDNNFLFLVISFILTLIWGIISKISNICKEIHSIELNNNLRKPNIFNNNRAKNKF